MASVVVTGEARGDGPADAVVTRRSGTVLTDACRGTKPPGSPFNPPSNLDRRPRERDADVEQRFGVATHRVPRITDEIASLAVPNVD